MTTTRGKSPEVKRGQKWRGPYHDTVKVMAVADGYVMFRYPHCIPGVLSLKEFTRRFKREASDGASEQQ